jgi:hypothetical protein
VLILRLGCPVPPIAGGSSPASGGDWLAAAVEPGGGKVAGALKLGSRTVLRVRPPIGPLDFLLAWTEVGEACDPWGRIGSAWPLEVAAAR